jgi:hypothetical protein
MGFESQFKQNLNKEVLLHEFDLIDWFAIILTTQFQTLIIFWEQNELLNQNYFLQIILESFLDLKFLSECLRLFELSCQ